MTNEHEPHELSGGEENERRAHRNRDSSVNNPWLSDQAKSIFLELGINIRNPESVEAFNEALDWAREGSKRQKWWREMRGRILLGSVVTFVAGGVGAIFSWLTSHISGSGH
jgi:hypothetical protein